MGNTFISNMWKIHKMDKFELKRYISFIDNYLKNNPWAADWEHWHKVLLKLEQKYYKQFKD